MQTPRRTRRGLVVGFTLALVAGLSTAPPASATGAEVVPDLDWAACGAEGLTTECATATLPMDYDEPGGATVDIAVARVPATNPDEKIGSLFFNFGGPGGTAVDYLQGAGAGIFASLNERFDIVTLDPRGVGQSSPSISCDSDPETTGIYSLPSTTPSNLDADALLIKAQKYVDDCEAANGDILSHVSTANVARDMHAISVALGDESLNYLGFSYGTFLGATYAALYPQGYRALVLDGPVDAEAYVNDPLSDIAAQTAGFESSLNRFLEACGRNPISCGGFALGQKPITAYDDLIRSADENPIPADEYSADPRPVTGDDINAAVIGMLYNKQLWGYLAQMLAAAAHGDGSLVRQTVQESWFGEDGQGGYDPSIDRYFTIGASEQNYPSVRENGAEPYLDRGAESWNSFPHFHVNSGYSELSYGLWTSKDSDAYSGPFTVSDDSPTPLVVATTYDPATPYQGAKELVADMGNARLLTMDGDNHTAYAGNSTCIDDAVDAYLLEGTLPAEGARCRQQVPFLPVLPDLSGLEATLQNLLPVG